MTINVQREIGSKFYIPMKAQEIYFKHCALGLMRVTERFLHSHVVPMAKAHGWAVVEHNDEDIKTL